MCLSRSFPCALAFRTAAVSIFPSPTSTLFPFILLHLCIDIPSNSSTSNILRVSWGFFFLMSFFFISFSFLFPFEVFFLVVYRGAWRYFLPWPNLPPFRLRSGHRLVLFVKLLPSCSSSLILLWVRKTVSYQYQTPPLKLLVWCEVVIHTKHDSFNVLPSTSTFII